MKLYPLAHLAAVTMSCFCAEQSFEHCSCCVQHFVSNIYNIQALAITILPTTIYRKGLPLCIISLSLCKQKIIQDY